MDSPRQIRISIVGTTSTGKTTLAKQLAKALNIPHIELDALFWGPNWTPTPRELFRQKAMPVIAQPCWVMDGNYDSIRDLVWDRATTVIWLNYSFLTVFRRLLFRTLKRIVTQEELFSGNRENFRGCFFAKDSLFLWMLQTHFKMKVHYASHVVAQKYPHLQAIELKNQKQANALITSLCQKNSHLQK